MTETGYKPTNSKITDFGEYELILKGNTPVVVIWKNSTIIYQKNKGSVDQETKKISGQDQFYTKQYKIGDFWNAYLVDDSSGVDFSNLTSNNIFKTVSTTRQYSLVMFEEHITTDDYLQFFCVFNDDNENIGGKEKNQDRQLLYLSNVTNFYSPYNNGKFAMQLLTFSSVNDRTTKSGSNTLTYIQYSSPGSGYAFPAIKEGIVTLNRVLMRDIGVRYAHRQSYGIELLTSCYYYGRPIIQGQKPNQIDKEEIFEEKVFASRRLFIGGSNEFSSTEVKNNGGLFAGINDPISINSHPETTFYNIMDARPTGYTNYKDWQSFLKSKEFDLLAQKDFKGLLAFNKSLAINSNGSGIGTAKMFWDSQWYIDNLNGLYNVEMSSNFKYKDPDTGNITSTRTVDYSKISQKYMSAVLNFNSVVFSTIIQLPYDSVQWLPFALNSIPLIGKFLNLLTLGIPTGFILTQNSAFYKKMQYFNGFMSAFFADNLSSIIGGDSKDKDALVPLNVFSTNNDFELGKMLGSNISTTAMTMKLTDRISVYPLDEITHEKLATKEQISTVDLSQKRNKKIYLMDETSEFLDIKSEFTNIDTDLQWNPTINGIAQGQEYAYIIDAIITQSLHQGQERHTFYSDNPFTYQGDYNDIAIAQFQYNNMGALTGNAFNWTTIYKLNHDEYKETEQNNFSYPAQILPSDPLDWALDIVFNKEVVIAPINNSEQLVIIHEGLLPEDNTSNWFNNNKPGYTNYDINIIPLLNGRLKIKNFQDLQRYYKSVSIYYSYNIETEYGVNNGNGSNFDTTENFNEPKSMVSGQVVEINLSNLVFSKSVQEFETKRRFQIVTLKNQPSTPWGAVAYTNYERKAQYSLLTYSLNLTESAAFGDNMGFYNTSMLGFDIVTLSDDNLHWNINFFIATGEVYGEYSIIGKADPYAKRRTKDSSMTISKIIINPR